MTNPVLTIRPAQKRGISDHGWLKSAHSFSFAEYYDSEHTQFGTLRVINDDRVAGGGGFASHPHRDVEIFSYVLEGALEHKDSMGNGSIVKAGGIQYMSAGSGVVHSESNPSASEAVHFMQVWLLPDTLGVAPRYETQELSAEDKDGQLALFLSPDGRGGSIASQSSALVFAATLTGSQCIEDDLGKNQRSWIQVARGSMRCNNVQLYEGDGLAIEGGGLLVFEAGIDAEFLLFQL